MTAKRPSLIGVGDGAQVFGDLGKTLGVAVVGQSVAGALRRDQADAPFPRRSIRQGKHQARARCPVQREHRQSAWIAVFGASDATSVGKREDA